MPNPVTHFEVIGGDGKKLQDFYGQVFSWQIDANNPMNYGMVSSQDGQGIGGGIGADHEEGGRGVTFYIEVAELEDTLQAVEKAGGRTTMTPTDVPGGPRMAQFLDPEGNRLGLVQAGSMPGGNRG